MKRDPLELVRGKAIFRLASTPRAGFPMSSAADSGDSWTPGEAGGGVRMSGTGLDTAVTPWVVPEVEAEGALTLAADVEDSGAATESAEVEADAVPTESAEKPP
ncbi:MAG: hypothetical protein P8099_03665 [Gemmatimonadota bacterium]